MTAPFECAGAPRDIGLDQGRACGASLRAELARNPWWERLGLRLGRGGAGSARIARDLRRHFPQQAEALEGMARGARVPRAWLVRALAREAGAGEPGALAAVARAGGLLARAGPGRLVVRRTRPEGGFASLEVTRPWRTAGLAGVNESGLAVVSAPAAAGLDPGRCAAPAALLVWDCLLRFASVEAALDWCAGRPGGGRATLVFADARGELGGVVFEGDRRRVLRPTDGVLVRASRPERESEVAKALRDADPLAPGDLARVLGPGLVAVDPAARRLGLLSAARAELDWIEL